MQPGVLEIRDVMQSHKGIRSFNTLRTMYFANFYSHVRYGVFLFVGWVTGKVLKKNVKLQKRMIRLISNMRTAASIRECLYNGRCVVHKIQHK